MMLSSQIRSNIVSSSLFTFTSVENFHYYQHIILIFHSSLTLDHNLRFIIHVGDDENFYSLPFHFVSTVICLVVRSQASSLEERSLPTIHSLTLHVTVTVVTYRVVSFRSSMMMMMMIILTSKKNKLNLKLKEENLVA